MPCLNLIWYDDSFLLTLASTIGKPVKVDMHTLKVARGRFARICVEIDLNQPVVGRVGVEGRWHNVEYEGLHIICAQCGCYGHLLKDCPKKPPSGAADHGGAGEQKQNHSKENIVADVLDTITKYQGESANDEVEEIMHIDWLVVPRRKRITKTAGGEKLKGYTNKGVSNKFHALNMESLEEIDPVKQQAGPIKNIPYNSQKNWSNKKRQQREQVPAHGPNPARAQEAISGGVVKSSAHAVGNRGKKVVPRRHGKGNDGEHDLMKEKMESLLKTLQSSTQCVL